MGDFAMYDLGDRVRVTAWEFDLQSTKILVGTVVQVSGTNQVIVELDSGERRQFQFDEVERISK
jgi:translation initiation factor IF-1